MSEIRLSGRLLCRTPAEADIVARHLPAHIELTSAEPGCIAFAVTPTEDPLVWDVEERFVSPEAFGEHQERAAASAWGQRTAGIVRDYSVTGLTE
jgi:quinol monooxygenase YgiN